MTELNEITKIGQRITKDTAEHQHHVGIKNDSGFLPLTVILMNFNTCLWERNIYALLASRISGDSLTCRDLWTVIGWVPSDSSRNLNIYKLNICLSVSVSIQRCRLLNLKEK